MSDGAFLGYIALLFASAVLLSVLAIRGFGQSTLARVFDGVLAAAFLAYAVYLLLFFDGGNVRIFIYAFLVPILAVVQMVRHRKAQREAAAQSGGFPQAGGYAQPGGSPQAGGYAQPGGSPQAGGYAQPGGSPQAGGYAQPGGSPQAGGYAQPGGYAQQQPVGQPAQQSYPGQAAPPAASAQPGAVQPPAGQ